MDEEACSRLVRPLTRIADSFIWELASSTSSKIPRKFRLTETHTQTHNPYSHIYTQHTRVHVMAKTSSIVLLARKETQKCSGRLFLSVALLSTHFWRVLISCTTMGFLPFFPFATSCSTIISTVNPSASLVTFVLLCAPMRRQVLQRQGR